MATAASVPLKLKLKQTYPLLSRPLPAKPITFSSANTFCADPPKIFKDHVKLQCLLSLTNQNQCQYLTTTDDSKSGSQWRRNLIKDKWPLAATNPNMKKLGEDFKKHAMAAVVLLGLLSMYNPKPALAARVGRLSATLMPTVDLVRGTSYTNSGTRDTFDYVFCNLVLFAIVAVPVTVISKSMYCIPFLVLFAALLTYCAWVHGQTSVVKLQLQYDLSGMGGRALQMDLNRIAEAADTSTNEGLGYVLTESVMALLRHPNGYISGYSSVVPKFSSSAAQNYWKQLCYKERLKFETLVDEDNVNLQRSTSQRSSKEVQDNEYIVVMLLVAALGKHKFPTIMDTDDLMKALETLGSFVPHNLLIGVEVMWSPQFSSSETST